MYCNEILKTIRGDTFSINIVNKDYDVSQGDIVKMSLKRDPDSEVILTTSGILKDKDATILSFSPAQMKDKEGFYHLDIEISNRDRSFVYTPLLSELKVEKDVTEHE